MEQGVQHLHDFLEHATQDSLLGCLLRASYEQALLETGLGGTLFQHNFQTWRVHHTPSLIQALWEFCQVAHITLAPPKDWVQLKLQQQNDCFVMEAIEGTKVFTPEQLERINWCQRHLQVLTLVDIATSDGKRVCPSCFQGDHDKHHPSTWEWPTEKPGRGDWVLWRVVLSRISL